MHRNARLTPAGRLLLCQRIEAGWPVAHPAESMGISRDRAYVWWRRDQAEGAAGLEDRSSRPHRCPTRTKPSRERRIVGLRRAGIRARSVSLAFPGADSLEIRNSPRPDRPMGRSAPRWTRAPNRR
jgi:leucine-zipper of insertion element IS481